jgi:acetoacetate decarboxylase
LCHRKKVLSALGLQISIRRKRAMFTLDPHQSYMMPAHFGPRYIGAKTSGWYHDVTAMVVSYKTDRAKLAAYLPEAFEVADDAIVSVFYACNKQVDWLAGRGYNLLGVNAQVVFKGDKDRLVGTYNLVMWENLTDAILSGRELQGIPKVFADIPDHQVNGGRWQVAASHFDNPIIDMAIDGLVKVSAEDVEAQLKADADKDNPMAWRFMPAVGGFGPPTVNEVTIFPSKNEYSEVFVGSGELSWANLTWEQNPTQYHIVNALAGLPVLEYLPALVTRGRTNLSLPERWSRTLSR